MAIAAPRGRADGDEHRVGLGHRLGHRGGEEQSLLAHVARNQRVQAGLEDWHFAGFQPCDLARILVDTGDHMAEIGKTSAGHQTDISGPNHRHAHTFHLFV